MKKFKPNKMTTFMFVLIEIFTPIGVGIPIEMLLEDRYTAREVFSLFPVFLLTPVFVTVFCCLLNLVTLPFTKYTVYLFDDYFTRGNIKVNYGDVTKIVMDSGLVTRIGVNEPCCLDCYAGDELLLSIEHPSLLMTFFVTRRCRNAKLRYRRVKRLLVLWGIILLIGILLGLYGAQ